MYGSPARQRAHHRLGAPNLVASWFKRTITGIKRGDPTPLLVALCMFEAFLLVVRPWKTVTKATHAVPSTHIPDFEMYPYNNDDSKRTLFAQASEALVPSMDRVSKRNSMVSKHQMKRAASDSIRTSATPATASNSVAATSLLELLHESEPADGKPLSSAHIRSRMAVFRKYLAVSEELREQWNISLERSQQRGIVVAAGRSGAILNAYIMLYTLRKGVNCSLPVVVMHYGEAEFKTSTRHIFQLFFENVKFTDLSLEQYPKHHLHLDSGGDRREFGYKIKVYAIYKSPFREVIFLDADSNPLQDPEVLFHTTIYRKYGNIFWNDFWKDPVPLWSMLYLDRDPWKASDKDTNIPIDELSEIDIARKSLSYPFEAESGQIVLDKERYWDVLEWLLFLNTHSNYVYRFALGDKDTFRAAFDLAGKTTLYQPSPFGPSLPLHDLGPDAESNTNPPIRYRCLGMLQLHPENGSPLFHHRTADAKFRPLTSPGEYLSPITHVTPPVTQDQASIMNWGNPGNSIFQASGSVTWGLNSKSVNVLQCKMERVAKEDATRTIQCPCNPEIELDKANLKCSGRSELDVEIHPEPILVLQIPKTSYIYQISRVEVEGYNVIPFQEL